jgi:hypothetical protein
VDGAAIGTFLGVLLGVLGALVGVIGGLNRAPRQVAALLWLGVAVGASALVVMGFAVVGGQPRVVRRPLITSGIVGLGVFGLLIPMLRKANMAREVRQMDALDAWSETLACGPPVPCPRCRSG